MKELAFLTVMVPEILTLFSGGAAFAQEGQSSQINSDTALETIVVTARRRDENAQSSPVSLSVLLRDQIGTGGMDDIEKLIDASANTLYNPQGGPLTIRGVGSLGIDGGVERQLGVGLFIDDVFVGRAQGFPSFLGDLERAEIVRGSQAVIYGKNTIGGAVNLVSREPGDSFSPELEGSVGSGGYYRIRGGVDIPVVEEKFLMRGFFSLTRRDGYIENTYTGKKEADIDTISGRLTGLLLISEETTAKLTLDFEQDKSDGGIPYVPLEIALERQSILDHPAGNNRKRGGINLRITHAPDDYELTSISAYRAFTEDMFLDGDFSSMPFLQQGGDGDQWQISQELRISSLADNFNAAGDFRWMAGLFYLHEDFKGSQFYEYVGVPVDSVSRNSLDQTTDTYSVFGEIGYHISDQLEVTGGIRYSYEDKTGKATVVSPMGTYLFGLPAETSDTLDFSNVSPELGITYQLSDDAMIYVRGTHGFKAGGISQFFDVGGTANIYSPETAWSFEGGAKTSWFEERLHLNFAIFAVDWKDQQVRVQVDPSNPTLRAIRNAASSKSRGFEIEAKGKLTAGLTMHLAYGFLDSKFKDFVDPVLGQDFSGNRQPYAPKHTFTGALRWEHETQTGHNLFMNGNYNYKSNYSFDVEGAYKQVPTHIVNAELGIKGEMWSVSVWGKNLFDQKYLKGYFRSSGNDYGVSAEGVSAGVTFKIMK